MRKKLAILALAVAAAIPSGALADRFDDHCPPGHCRNGDNGDNGNGNGGNRQQQQQQQQQQQEQRQCILVIAVLEAANC